MAEIIETTEAAGSVKEYILSGSSISTRKELHLALAELMSFPEWYGKNLDALNDVLTDIGEDTCLVITEADALEEALKTYYHSLLRVLKRASEENPHFSYRMR